jgi:2-dehydropantoate 2-reductase
MARVAVVGVGAIGGVIAGLLQVAGRHEILLCTRRPMAELRVDTPDGVVIVKAKNITDPAQGEVVDWVLVATKTYDIPGAKKWIETLAGEKTVVAAIQNGVEHRELFAPMPVLPVIIDTPTERRPDGSVWQRGGVVMRVEKTAQGEAFAELFAGTKAELDVTDDFLTAAWQKLAINAGGLVSGVTLKPGGVLRDEEMGRIGLELVEECCAVGRAVGAKLEDDLPAKVLARYRAALPDHVNSLLADRLAGRQTEIDVRNGVIVRLGAKMGIATPVNRMMVGLLKAMEG